MRPSSAVHPRDEDEETPADPEPQSRKARKYIDRKAPKVNFLRKIFWSKKRRWVFFLFTIAVFLVNLAVIANFSMHFKTHVMPPIYRYMFLGYNFLYNTQEPGTLIRPGWMLQMIWRSWWFYAQALLSLRILWVRAYNIKHHEHDIGTWLKKDWQMLYYKLSRLLFLLPVAIILLADVMPMKNPAIVNIGGKDFERECELTPDYQIGLESSFQIQGAVVCNTTTMLSNLPLPESTYKGYIPDGGPSATAGSIMVSMRPVGTCVGCVRPTPAPLPEATFFTKPNRFCSSNAYPFSNWVTISDVCDSLFHNDFYRSAYLKDNGFVEQWFCNTNSTKNSTHMTVFYDTVFGRLNSTQCQNALDASFIKSTPGLLNGTQVSEVISNLIPAELKILADRYYVEYDECRDIQVRGEPSLLAVLAPQAYALYIYSRNSVLQFVSCLENLDIDTKDAAPFYRSIAMYGCKRTFQGSLTADSDQKDLDTWQSDWVYAYKLASAGMAAEFAWDYIEYLAYAFI